WEKHMIEDEEKHWPSASTAIEKYTMEKWTDNNNREPYTSRGVRTVRRRVLGNTTIAIWKGAGYLAYIVANRVGFDGKVASDSNSYKKMADLSRRLEKQYNLKQVLSPRAFLSPEERRLPRHDQRKEKLKEDIRKTLKEVSLFPEFQKRMEGLGYQVIKGRGISFIDDKKVKIKGSEVGFSLAKIEKILTLKQELAARQKQKIPGSPQEKGARVKNPDHRFSANPGHGSEPKAAPEIRTETMIVSLLSRLLEPEKEMGGGVPYELTEEYLKRKRKKPKISH